MRYAGLIRGETENLRSINQSPFAREAGRGSAEQAFPAERKEIRLRGGGVADPSCIKENKYTRLCQA